MRNITRSLGLIIGATLLFSSCLPSEATTDNMKLWYDKPADEWMKSLPFGNGRLGAMVYGGVETETIDIVIAPMTIKPRIPNPSVSLPIS